MDGREIVLLVTVVLLVLYVIAIGGATATAIRIGEAWRRHPAKATTLGPGVGDEVVLQAPSLPIAFRRVRVVGWAVFPIALVLAVFANRSFAWIGPAAVVVMVGLNAFYFTAMQGMGEPLTLTKDGFRLGVRGRERSVRWVHVTDLVGARLGAFSGIRMSEPGEWQDPKLRPNVIFFRLNRALVRAPRTLLQRLRGFSYYDGAIRNLFGVPTEQLLHAMREYQRLAIDAEAPPFRRPRPGEQPGRS
ncbi:MAG: hypothetical protein AUG06_06580 [Actinobacteria bacterium 13_1_20CM_2_65_11]|nr:MAG: hypothetical protein AUH40_07205 [Chloroflexi bacterium 13_1_40CM_65_17]OLC66852.1 MAG: hypothetical protein AUH69_06060 [Actinobacteria bacterium 13_1_40CM_4_65_12]OLD26339.1 MAG: hypothetical protein AUJ02_02550 [Chloroflexi bacterium 13_1_40CM_3_65_12]OLE79862.1 MAG: hypothetical protein AUG06_06580 [Actinobacteria bacterium 13_1_20CM_2_65_11]